MVLASVMKVMKCQNVKIVKVGGGDEGRALCGHKESQLSSHARETKPPSGGSNTSSRPTVSTKDCSWQQYNLSALSFYMSQHIRQRHRQRSVEVQVVQKV